MRGGGDAGVVEKQIEPSKNFFRPGKQLRYRRWVADIRGHSQRPRTRFPCLTDNRFQNIPASPREDNRISLARQRKGNRLADSAACAGD
jgi:hypothetical protein